MLRLHICIYESVNVIYVCVYVMYIHMYVCLEYVYLHNICLSACMNVGR